MVILPTPLMIPVMMSPTPPPTRRIWRPPIIVATIMPLARMMRPIPALSIMVRRIPIPPSTTDAIVIAAATTVTVVVARLRRHALLHLGLVLLPLVAVEIVHHLALGRGLVLVKDEAYGAR